MIIEISGEAEVIVKFYASLLSCSPSDAVAFLANCRKLEDVARVDPGCVRCGDVTPAELNWNPSTGQGE